ncbi:VWA domain-containing protein [Mycolicibacterium flavescens]|uniref:VWFA domain-containing protein n=1 Tax=Mycolicibacterium flavescens TaxID=1776 RepID=A0A1E3RE56_MYCFV|nr:vWA domain-containing protein [Mycolicibacterium flavescens]MCV7278490.1 VWA domain-containing protein [Mycolicibacterium flavescens]ODQ87732.1 hypothetical protein BHQ18_21965 [Mycolicibacterium flavescens]
MTFSPVVPPALLLAVAVVALLLRLITMGQLARRSGHRWTTVWRWSGLTLAVLLMLIAAARPTLGGGDGADPGAAAAADDVPNIFLLVDRSADTAVADHGDGPRIDGIRDDVTALIDHYPQARFALITFAARPSLEWPLSEDAWSLAPTIAGVRPLPAEEVGVNAAAASNVLRYQLIAAGQRTPGAPNLVFYFGPGAPGSKAPQGEFEPVPGSVDGGAVFGYGAARDDAGLQRIADQLGVPYVPRDPAQPVGDAAPEAAGVAAGPAPVERADRTDLYWVFTLAAAVLLLFEIFLNLREYRAARTARREVTL